MCANKEEEIEKNEEIVMVELQSEDEKKAEVVRKADNNKELVTKEQRENKNMILNKDENTENTKSEGEANNKVQNVGEIIEDDKVPVEIANTQTKAKQQDKDIVASKTSNNQQQKETTDNGERKKVEESKDGDSEQQGKDDKTCNFRSASTREKIEMKKRMKEDNIDSELTQ